MTWKRTLAPAAILLSSTALAVLLAEGAARLLVEPGDFLQAELVDDPVLNHRIRPFTTGHDALGFRNEETPARAGIVAIGDSMTYGVGARREHSWPHQLSALLGERVYNMGLGGFGPLQYLHLARSDAQALRPRLLVVGFYLGNDLMDALYLARGRPYWHGWLAPAEAAGGPTDYDRAGAEGPRRRFAALRDWLARNSLLYAVLRATVLRPLQAQEQQALAVQSGPEVRMPWRTDAHPAVATIFTPRLRLAALDLGIPSVREGMHISQRALEALRQAADAQRAGLLVVLIPTKERVYCDRVLQSPGAPPEAFRRLCVAEEAANGELRRFLVERGIAFVDVAPALTSRVARNEAVYPADADGHPQASGYAVIAGEVAAAVRERFPPRRDTR